MQRKFFEVSEMLPYATFNEIHIGPVTFYVWGIMVALGILVGLILASREAKRKKLDPEEIYNIGIISVVSGILGARLVFALENPGALTSFWDFFRVWEGGLAFHGGFLGALGVGFLYIKIKKLDFPKYLDTLAPSIAIGHAIGRIGCILTGLHLGKETTSPLGVYYDGTVRHLTPLYEMVGLIVLFVILMKIRGKEGIENKDGFLFAIYLTSYSALRFVVEFFRADPVYYGLTIAQYITAVLFLAGVSIIFLKARK